MKQECDAVVALLAFTLQISRKLSQSQTKQGRWAGATFFSAALRLCAQIHMRIHSSRFTGIVLLLALMLAATAIKLVRSAPAAPDPRVQAAERRLKVKELDVQAAAVERNAMLRFYGAAFLIVTSGLAVLIVASGRHRAAVKRASVFLYKIGQYNEVMVHERDLSLAAPVAMGLINAEQLKQSNAGMDTALELYRTLAEVQTRQMRELLKQHPHPAPLSGGEFHPWSLAPGQLCQGKKSWQGAIPTFRELLERGEIARGKPMILGYERGAPRRGSFLDIYSAAVAGESGSGKTATLLFLIGSGLVAQRIRFLGIDPHYPHPKSLGFKTKPLWEAGLMQMATFKDDMLAVLHMVEQTIDDRLKQVDTETTPVVLVIDELAFLVKTSIGPAITHTMERISTEGRKCAVYMLASSQTWLAARTGNTSVVRDTLTSAYVHRIKPKQANLLLQDKDEAEKVKKQVKHAGEALLVPVGDESAVVKIPFTTDADMLAVVAKVTEAPEVKESTPTPSQEGNTAPYPAQKLPSWEEPEVDSHAPRATHHASIQTEYGLRLRTRELLAACKISYGEIERETGIGKSTAYNWIKHPQKTLKPEQKTALKAYLARLDQKAAMPV